MNAIQDQLLKIAAAVAKAQSPNGTWGVGKDPFYCVSQTTFGCSVLRSHGASYKKQADKGLRWLATNLAAATSKYPRTIAWPLLLFSDLNTKYWKRIASHLVDDLCRQQNADGSWGHGTGHKTLGGAARSGAGHPFPTALAVLALSAQQLTSRQSRPVVPAINKAVTWLKVWLEAHGSSQLGSSSFAIWALHASKTHLVTSPDLAQFLASLAHQVEKQEALTPEVIPDAARKLDAPYVLLSSAWVLNILSRAGDVSTLRAELKVFHQVLELVRPNGEVGVTREDANSFIYSAFNVHFALQSFDTHRMNDKISNMLISDRNSMKRLAVRHRARRLKVFIGSSVEGLPVARKMQECFEHDRFDAVTWEQGVFQPSATTMEALETALSEYDYAIFVMTPDDIITSRGEIRPAIRDNVLFELGLFIGSIGRKHVFMVHPRQAKLRIPSDLLGVSPITYLAERFESNAAAAVGPACNQIRERVTKTVT